LLEEKAPSNEFLSYEFSFSPGEAGYYKATFHAKIDSSGIWYKDTATLKVIPLNPVAVIEGPTKAIENRPFPRAITNERSYSPVEDRDGVTIDHSKDEWRYKEDSQSSWINVSVSPNSLPLGTYIVEARVTDSVGRVSDWATHHIEIIPDQPPTVDVIGIDTVYRNQEEKLYIDAKSPDYL